MRVRVLCLVLTLAALGGCQSTPSAPGPTSTSATPSRTIPKPGPDTPRGVLRFRPVLTDPASFAPAVVTSTSNPAPVTDPAAAAKIRQAPRLAQDPDALKAALASLDCPDPDPIKGKDDPALPLATCGGDTEYGLGPAVLDDRAVDHASYQHDTESDSWVVWLSFTPSGARAWADFTGSNQRKRVAIVLDGQVLTAPQINDRIDGDTQIAGAFTEQTARDLAATVNNH